MPGTASAGSEGSGPEWVGEHLTPCLSPHAVLTVRCQPAVLGHCMGLFRGTMAPLLSSSEHIHACQEQAGPPRGRRQDISAANCSGAQPLKILPPSAEVK